MQLESDKVDVYDDSFGFKTLKPENFINKQRVFIGVSWNVSKNQTLLYKDFKRIIPHSKSDSKIERENMKEELQYNCQSQGCQNFLFINQQGKQFYLYVGKYDKGPTVQYLVQDYNTLEDIRLLGNSLLGSWPILSFSKDFKDDTVKKIEQLIWTDIFNIPLNHPKSQPFIDKTISFIYDREILNIRIYQIDYTNTKADDIKLYEIGPRLVLQKVRVLNNFMFGQTLFKNASFLNSRAIREKLWEKQKLIAEDKQNTIQKKISKKQKIQKINEENLSLEDQLGL